LSIYTEEEDAKVEADSSLVSRMEKRKKTAAEPASEPMTADQEAFLVEQAIGVARELKIHTASLIQKNVVEEAHKVLEYAEAIEDLVAEKADVLLKATMQVKREKVDSEDVVSEVGEGNSSIHIFDNNTIDLDSPSPSNSPQNIDDIPFNKVYKILDKVFTPSPSTQTQKKPDDVDTFEPLSIDERIGALD